MRNSQGYDGTRIVFPKEVVGELPKNLKRKGFDLITGEIFKRLQGKSLAELTPFIELI